MNYPDFFKEVPTVTLYDPLAEILGSIEKGVMVFDYLQIVQATGHSCPTVGGAYLMSIKALESLYPDSIPLRGGIEVSFKEDLEDGTVGVVSNVISHITGATDKSGFKGLKGKFVRHSLLSFNSDINSSARFTRLDTAQSIDIFYDPSSVLPDPKMMPLMQKILEGTSTAQEKEQFGILWQDRVKRVMIDHCDDVIRIEKV